MNDVSQPLQKEKRRWRERGNAIVMLFAAIGMAGVVTYGLNNVMRGPGVMTAEVSRKTIAENNLVASSRLAINAATKAQSNDGDCDSDGFVEPVPFRAAGGAPAPVGGGLIPMTIGASTSDPWGAQYGYCVWDAGTVKKTDAHAGCGGAGANRLDGGPKDNQPAIAVISAGKNGAFETSCVAYVDANDDGKPDANMVNKPAGSDDVVLSYTYAEANGIGGGEWKLDALDNAETGKNLEIAGGGTFQGPVTLTDKGLVLPGDPGDNSITGACDAGKDQQLRRNTSTSPASLEICDFAGVGWTGISGGGSPVATDEYFDPNGSNCTANESGSLAQVGTVSVPNAGDVYSDGSYIYLTQNNAVGVYTFNGNNFVPVTTFGTSTSGSVQGDGTYIYNVNEAGDLLEAWYFNGTTATMIDSVATGNVNEDVWSDGQYVYTSTQTQIRAYTFDGADLVLRDTEAVGAFSIWGDGTYVYSLGNNNLTAWTFNGTALTQVATTAIGGDQGAALWGDGTYIYAALRTRLAAFTFDGAAFTLEGANTSIDAFDVWGDGVNVYAPTLIGAYATIFDGSTFTVDSSVPVTHDFFPQLRGDGNFLYSTTGTAGAYNVVALSGYRCTEPPPRTVVYSSYEEDAVDGLTDALDVGMIAHWPMNEGTGTAVEDVIGTYEGTFVNTPVWNKGPNDDGSLSFNMDDRDAVQITGLMGSQPIGTISLWANIGRSDIGINPPKQSNLFSIADSVVIATRDYVGVSVYLYQGGATWLALNSGQAIESTGWHYITTTFDDTANIWRLYIDGVLAANSTTAMTLTYTGVGANTFIGRQGNGSTAYDFDGGIDDVRMYNRALSPNEVAALYKKVKKESASRDTSAIAPSHNSYEGLITNGQDAACAIKLDGTPWCWGWDASEVLGNGTGTTNQASPVPVSIPTTQTYYLVTTASGIAPGGNLYTKQLLTEPNVANTPNATAITPGSSNNGYGFTQANVYGKDDGGGPRAYTVTMNFAASNTCIQASVYAARVNSAGTVQGSEVKIGNDSLVSSTSVTFTGEANLGAFAYTDRLQIRYNMRNLCGTNQTPTVNFNNLSTVTVPALEYPAWTQISTFWNSTCGLRADGTAWCWGSDANGQLGNGTILTGTQSVPTPVFNSSSTRWAKISTGGSHACGIKEDGTLWCWGADGSGQVGDGGGTGGVIPIAIGAATDWFDISAGLLTTCGLRGAGDAYCWGADGDGQVGNNAAFADQTSPVAVVGGPWSQIATRGYHTCAVKTDGSLWCWGDDAYERLGVPATSTDQALPVKIDNGPWTYVSPGEFHTCAIKADSTVWCWGRSDNYRLGTSTTTNWPYPVMVPGSKGTVGLESGSTSSCLIKADRTVLCWGSDTAGSIGNGAVTTGDSPPAPVTGFPGKPAWSWNDAATLITPPIGTNVAMNGNYLSSTANNDGLGYTAAGKANLRQVSDPSQLLLETTANASSVQMSFTNDNNYAPPGDYLTGLISRLEFNGIPPSTSAVDSSGNFNGLTLGGVAGTQPTWSTGFIDGALNFDGVNDFLTGAGSAGSDLNMNTTMTVMAWIKFDTALDDGGYRTIYGRMDVSASSTQYRLGVSDGNLVVDACTGGSNASCVFRNSAVVDSILLVPGTWYHLAFTFSNPDDDLDLYINGVNVPYTEWNSPSTAWWQTSALPIYVGRETGEPYLDGLLEEIRVYNTKLTDQQITSIYNFTMGITDSGGPKAYTMGVDHATNNFEIGRDIVPATNWLNAIDPDIAITSTGRVGVGTASPAVKMEVAGGVKFGAESYCATGRDGAIRYVSGSYQYCDGTEWVNLGGAGGAGGGGGGTAPTDGLIHHWKLDETAGTTIVDSGSEASSGDFDGTLRDGSSNAPKAVTSDAGQDGTSLLMDFEYIDDIDPIIFGPTDSLTISVWNRMEMPDWSDGREFILDQPAGDGEFGYRFRLWNNKLEFIYIDTGDQWRFYRSTADVYQQNVWTHYAVSYTYGDGASMKLYVDGQEVPGAWVGGYSGNNPPKMGGWSTWISGRDDGPWTGFVDGNLDDLRMYDRALSASDIQQIYACTGGTGSCTYGLPADCTGLGDEYYNDPVSGNCYFKETTGVDFTTAEAACNAEGGHLATPLSAAENNVLKNNFTSTDAWIGLEDLGVEGTWVYAGGTQDGVQFWSGDIGGSAVGGRYNDWDLVDGPDDWTGQDCGMLHSGGYWDDSWCGDPYDYICQIDGYGSGGGGTPMWKTTRLPSFHKSISGAFQSTYAIKTNGTLWATGQQLYGSLGNNDDTGDVDFMHPVHSDVSDTGWTDWVSVTGNIYDAHACGLRANGTAWCWGDAIAGSIGDNAGTTDRSRPTAVRGVANAAPYTDWIQVSNMCGVRANGTAYCWGPGTVGQNGNGANSNQNTPVVVSGSFTDWLMVSRESMSGGGACGLRANGMAYCWGQGASGALGNGATGNSNVPVAVHDLDGAGSAPTSFTDWIMVDVGYDDVTSAGYACGIRANGMAYCWGENGLRTLGNGTTTDSTRPVAVHDLDGAATAPTSWSDWIYISAGMAHTCGIRANGAAYCWGANDVGQLGTGNTTNAARPVQVRDTADAGYWYDWVSITAGSNQSCGTRVNGEAYCWGEAYLGQLGNNETTGVYDTPQLVE